MGSGKTAVGRRLARDLRLSFVDSDDEIEARTGVDIAYIFEKEGEEGFREREAQILLELTELPETVLATGGGAVIREENRKLLSQRGTVIYLYTTVGQQLLRTRGGATRPLLNRGKRREVLEALMEVRGPLYQEIADVIVETDWRSVGSVAREIRDRLDSV